MNQLRWLEEPLPACIGPHRVIAPLSVGRETDVLLAVTHGPHGFTRQVVLKRLRPDRAPDAGTLRSLAREAMAYARLNHPSIVRLYDFFEDEGQCVLVLEYVHGLTLRDLVAHLHVRGEAMPDGVALYVMAQVFSALAAAHAAREPSTGEFASVIHRDVTPKNVLIDWDGTVKLSDFGIAKLTGVTSDTRAGLLKGTYGYMAPEQVLGDPTTVRTDVYAGCLLLRELLLGRRTFVRGEMPELEFLQLMAEPQLPPIEKLRPGVPPRVCHVLRVGLETHADRRDIASAEIRDVLLAAVDAEKAREQLAALLHELRTEQKTPSLEQTEATEPQSWDEPVPVLRDSEPRHSPSGVRMRRERVVPRPATVPDAGPPTFTDEPSRTTPDAGPRTMPDEGPRTVREGSWTVPEAASSTLPAAARPTMPTLQVPTAPSAFRIQAQQVGWRVRPQGRPALLLAGAAALLPLALIVGRLLVLRAQPEHAALHAVTAAVPVPPAPIARPGATDPSRATVSSPPGADAPASTLGAIVTSTRSHDHRIYVDGQVAGESGRTLEVRCGRHEARYGSQGRWQTIDVPCGGQYTLSPRW